METQDFSSQSISGGTKILTSQFKDITIAEIFKSNQKVNILTLNEKGDIEMQPALACHTGWAKMIELRVGKSEDLLFSIKTKLLTENKEWKACSLIDPIENLTAIHQMNPHFEEEELFQYLGCQQTNRTEFLPVYNLKMERNHNFFIIVESNYNERTAIAARSIF